MPVSQVVWAKTTKVGCGFTAWDEGSAGGDTPYRQVIVVNGTQFDTPYWC